MIGIRIEERYKGMRFNLYNKDENRIKSQISILSKIIDMAIYDDVHFEYLSESRHFVDDHLILFGYMNFTFTIND